MYLKKLPDKYIFGVVIIIPKLQGNNMNAGKCRPLYTPFVRASIPYTLFLILIRCDTEARDDA